MFSLATKEAYEAKQAAYKAMDEARNKVSALNETINTLYLEIDQLQSDYNLVNADAMKVIGAYRETIASYDQRIADVGLALREAKDLSEQFERKIDEEESACRKGLYQKVIALLNEQEIQLANDKKALIREKLSVKKPETPEKDELLKKLKSSRAEHARLKCKYQTLKDASARKHAEFKQAQAQYRELRDADKITFKEENNAKKIEALKSANIPEEFWDGATVSFGETETHIYYGGDESHAHGHIVLRNGVKNFVREPHDFNMKIS